MPKQTTENIGHASVTDHRILRNSSEIPAVLKQSASSNDQPLIYDTKPPSSNQTLANLRNMALAYSQVAGRFPELSAKGFELLERAATELPRDREVQTAFGLVLSETRPDQHERAVQALQHAIDLGSNSAAVRTHLARLQMQDDHTDVAIELLQQSIKMDPYDAAGFHNLAYVYSILNDDVKAGEVLKQALQIDPADDVARQMLLNIQHSPDKK